VMEYEAATATRDARAQAATGGRLG
jgi:hypothetical protein